jgi:AcrR family transcriptional regulator
MLLQSRRMAAEPLTRRERVRRQTLDEIRQHALAQVAEGGPSALSLNAIAKAMGMSGPAIYRYYASRDDLLAALVTDGYAELAAVVRDAAAAGARRAPARRLADVAEAYRRWAVANPYRYELLFGVRPEGYADPTEAIAAIQPGMQVILELIGEIASGAASAASGAASAASGAASATAGAPAPPPRRSLDAQLRRWAQSRGVDGPPSVLLLGVLAWTRLHGIVGLELAGITRDMGLDAALLVQAEVDDIVAAAGAAGRA